ncbi:ABC transporter ATP-binding protein/permease [Acholeplasma equirhinis]|uniref:ABC transporter ATP-binding protein/permease n=1 Tax=Acholeplasma equirhinis TaxID=555393 RepID=UPI00197A7C03|nr:ABC transporter ATP-binding protein/permease [Acholeplasma equirhinis]MBN3490394.1 ABC transporter ATP-binding protein/permease [Acholeplasma equirhinis]
MIKVTQLDKTFNKGSRNSIHVLNNVSMEFPEKGLVVLLGASGSGKTTLLNVIGGLDKVDRGTIQFYEHQIKGYKPGIWDKIRTQDIGYIFQNYYLMNDLSVFDNVAFVLKMIGITDKEAIEERVNYILNQVGMYRFRKKKATQLSGGQQQRVAIARALVKNPKVIIADEPTGNLDSKNTLEIMNIIKQISLTKLVVLVTHEKEIADFYGDRIIEIKDGQVVNERYNDNQSDHDFKNENIIYLKDLNEISEVKNDVLDAKVYTDQDDRTPISVKLIIKNKTLYLDVNSEINKIQLIDKDSHIQLKDEKFQKQTREQMMETTFDLGKLDHSDVAKSKSYTISTKTSFWIAFKRVLQFGAKGKLMLLIFGIVGALVANSFLNIYTILNYDYQRFISQDEKVLAINMLNSEGIPVNLQDRYDDIMEVIGDNTNYFILPELKTSYSLEILLPGSRNKAIYNSMIPEYHFVVDDSEIIYGRRPENSNEIMVSSGFYSTGDAFSDTNFKDIGIWSIEQLLGEIIINSYNHFETGLEFEIVGITNSVYRGIYAFDHVALNDLTDSPLLDRNITKEDYEKSIIFNNNVRIVIYGDNPLEIESNLREKGYDITLTSRQAMIDNQNQIEIELSTNIITAGFLVAGSLLIFYFVMRSSMLSRIYEIAVYRALGVKRREVVGSFTVEIVMITTISSFLGFVLMMIIMSQFNNTPLSAIATFEVDFMVFILGALFIYLSNLIIGIMPMLMLLRKTPAQIISSYDM